MKSLRETLETTFAAAAFAERDLHQEAREVMGADKARDAAKARAGKSQDKRPRPSLKA